MKKILAIALVLMLAVGCFCLTGCGDATFGGNYQEATAEDVQTFAENAALEQGSQEIDYTQGYQLVANVDVDGNKMEMDIKFANDDEKGLVLKADMKVSGDEPINLNAYVIDNYMYAQMEGQKVKMFDNMITPTYTGLLSELQDFDLSALALRAAEDTGIKLGMAQEADGTTKIKFEMPEETGIAGTIILVFDGEYNLTAMKFDVVINDVTMDLELKPFAGNINLPSDLDSYVGF